MQQADKAISDKRLEQAAAALLSSFRDAPLLLAVGAWREATAAGRLEKAREAHEEEKERLQELSRQQGEKRMEQAAAALLSSLRDAPLLIAMGAWREATMVARHEKAIEEAKNMQQADKAVSDKRLQQAAAALLSDRKSTRLNSSHSSVSRMPSSA